ncbi:XXYS1_4_G0010920.mRNA.1.CDS.1 [Saccharomyces cerevisiae]|nr:XXYS1_4_G0010920.mRNA.1.CDS.1 [Saccharomyces cerevisiae]
MTSVQNSPRLQQPQEQQQQQQQLSLKIKQLKLKRINELNNKLRKELSRERITASNACLTIINYTSNTKDYTLPELWGYPVSGSNHFIEGLKNAQKNSQMSNSNSVCCTLM